MKKLRLKKSNKAYSKAKYNVKRRRQYEDDPDYREKSKKRSRMAYREENETELLKRDRNLANLETHATSMEVRLPNGKNGTLPIFNIPKTAEMIDGLYQTVWRWVQRDMLPKPILTLVINGQPVYHREEVRVFIQELSKHLQNFAYYRKDHESTRKAIFTRVRKVRVQLNLIKE